jgi:hypothetical protein
MPIKLLIFDIILNYIYTTTIQTFPLAKQDDTLVNKISNTSYEIINNHMIAIILNNK